MKDGSRQDVTAWCQFSSRDEGIATVSPAGTVTPVRQGDTAIIVSYRNAFAAISTLVPRSPTNARPVTARHRNPIDARIQAKLDKLNIAVSPVSADTEFLRRVTLDTIGRLPEVAEIEAFCNSTNPEKRERKIDELLAHPRHAALWATRLCDMTRCDVSQMGEDERMQQRRAQMWHDWFRRRLADHTSYAEIVRGFLTATSRNGQDVRQWLENEEALIRQGRRSANGDHADQEFLDLYWRRLDADGKFPLREMAELTAAALTGVRLNCARCHKHPFDRWTQDDYAAFTNIFSRVIYGSSSELNAAVLAELEQRRQGRQRGEVIQPLPRLREVFISKSLGRQIPGSQSGVRVPPRAYGSGEFDLQRDLRQQLFEWLVEEDNPWFARNFVNRVWAVYFGKGIVDPVDDFSISNPPSHPLLLDDLARQFRESGFDIRRLEKQILMSETYQRTSTPNDSNRHDQRNLARQYVRPLLAEVALDLINQVLGTREDFGDEVPAGSLSIEVGSNRIPGEAGRALSVLGRGERQSVCDCDRRQDNDLRQFMFMIRDDMIFRKMQQGSIDRLPELADRPLVNRLYLRLLARWPTSEEMAVGLAWFGESPDRAAAFRDYVWALLNTREFITNH